VVKFRTIEEAQIARARFDRQAVTLVRLRIPGSQVSRAELTAIAIQIVLAVIAFR